LIGERADKRSKLRRSDNLTFIELDYIANGFAKEIEKLQAENPAPGETV
jgi:hypothetical protein